MSPTLIWLDSFEHQVASAATLGTNTGLYDTANNTTQMSFVTGRRGGASHALQMVQDGLAATRVSKTIVAGNQVLVESFYFKISAIPSVDSLFWTASAFIDSQIGMKATTGNIYYTAGSGAKKLVTGNWADGTWHRIDIKWDTSGTTYTLDFQIDGVSQVQHVSSTTTAADITIGHLGSTTAGHTLTVQFMDWVRSVTSGDYPIGPHQVYALIPNADGTHNWASTNMGPETGGVTSGTTTLHNSVADFPPDLTTFIQYTTNSATATEYAEITLPDISGSISTVWGARAIATLFAAGSGSNAATTRIVDGGGSTVLDLFVGDQGATALRYHAGMLPGIAVPGDVNPLKFRVGFPTDSNPHPQWSALMIDYAIPGESSQQIEPVDVPVAMNPSLTALFQPGGGGGGPGLSFTRSFQSMDTTNAPTDDGTGTGHAYYETAGTWSLPDQALLVAMLVTRDGNNATQNDSPLTVTHGALSLTRVSSACVGATGTQLETWIGFNNTGSAINSTTRATYPTTKTGGSVHAGFYSGFSATPSNVLDFVVGYSSATTGTVLTVPMASPQDPGNRTWAGWSHKANEAITYAGSGTTMGAGSYGTPANGTLSVADTSGAFNENPQASWATSSIGIAAALEIRVNQNGTGPAWGPGTPDYQFRSGSPWERPLGASPTVHSSNATYLLELDGRNLVSGKAADNHPYAAGTEVDGALGAALDSNPATTSMTVTSGTVTAFTGAGLSPPFSVLVDTANQEHMTVSAWGGSGNTVWTIVRTHPTEVVAHANGARVRTGKAFLHLVGGSDGSDGASTFDTAIYRVTDSSGPLVPVYPKNQAPDYGTIWTGPVGTINARLLAGSGGGGGGSGWGTVAWGTGAWGTSTGGGTNGARIPVLAQTYFNAEPPGTIRADASMVLIDSSQHYIAWFSDLHYYPSTGRWYCESAGIYYYSSYGVDGVDQTVGTQPPSDWPATLNGTGYVPTTYQDNPQNGGGDLQRGVNAQAAVIDYDRMWADGGLFQMNGVFMERTDNTGNVHYFPLTGQESGLGGLIREGTRFHIKNSVDVAARVTAAGFSGARALELTAIAKAAQDYGFVATDSSGAGCNTKLQNTTRDGRGNLWKVGQNDLQIFPFVDDWEFVQENYDPPSGAPTILTKSIAATTTISVGMSRVVNTAPPVGSSVLTDYRLVLANRSASGLGSPIISDVLQAGMPMGTDFALKWGRTLNSAGTLEFSLPIDACTPADFAPGQRELHLYRDSGAGESLVWGGHLWVADVRYPFVRFLGIGFYEALRHREMGDDFYEVGADSRSVAWDLISYTQGLANGGLGITRGTDVGTGAVRTVEACAEERKKISDMIEDLAGSDDGFDFEILPNKTWRTWSPLRGTDRTGTVHLDATTNIVDLSYTIDATSVENEVAGIGDNGGGNCEPITYTVVSDSASQAAYGLMQGSINRSDIRQDDALITGLATEELALQKQARKQPTIKLFQGLAGIKSPLNNDYDLGDTLLVSASRGYATFSDPFRLLAYSVSVDEGGNEFLEVTLDAVAT